MGIKTKRLTDRLDSWIEETFIIEVEAGLMKNYGVGLSTSCFTVQVETGFSGLAKNSQRK